MRGEGELFCAGFYIRKPGMIRFEALVGSTLQRSIVSCFRLACYSNNMAVCMCTAQDAIIMS